MKSIEQFYFAERNYEDSAVSKERYERMAACIRVAYEKINLEIDEVTTFIAKKKDAFRRENKAAIDAQERNAKLTKEELLEMLTRKD